MNEITQFWENRSRKFGTRVEGVLLKSVPGSINLYLNDWMLKQVKEIIDTRNGFKALDIGCGYGRLSEPLIKEFPGLQIFGVDVAQNYVDLYNKKLKSRGKALKADSRKLPFEENFFDAVFIVTSLMYLISQEDQLKAVSEIIRVLKPGGRFVILERSVLGYNIFTFGGLISKLRGKKNLEIAAVSFSPNYLSEIVGKSGGIISDLRGIPIFTILFPMVFILSLVSAKLGDFLLKIIKFIDSHISKFYYPSLYISYTGWKK